MDSWCPVCSSFIKELLPFHHGQATSNSHTMPRMQTPVLNGIDTAQKQTTLQAVYELSNCARSKSIDCPMRESWELYQLVQ